MMWYESWASPQALVWMVIWSGVGLLVDTGLCAHLFLATPGTGGVAAGGTGGRGAGVGAGLWGGPLPSATTTNLTNLLSAGYNCALWLDTTGVGVSSSLCMLNV